MRIGKHAMDPTSATLLHVVEQGVQMPDLFKHGAAVIEELS